MNNKNLNKAMSNLVRLDIDAVHAYDQAFKEIDAPIIRDCLLKFQVEGSFCGKKKSCRRILARKRFTWITLPATFRQWPDDMPFAVS